MRVSAPMLGAVKNGGCRLIDSWDMEDYIAGYCARSRHARSLKSRTRRAIRRRERAEVSDDLADGNY